ncbi:MAG: hypothetical protein ACI9VS_000879 [Candidatus Binatia bacterium]|jgi:hypothetical protein
MNDPKYFIDPGPEKIAEALEDWAWIGLEGKKPILTTAFGDVFLEDPAGIWFLDTLEGRLELVCATLPEFESLLSTTEGKDRYLLAGFVEAAAIEGMALTPLLTVRPDAAQSPA